jgi:CBS domain-containing protein
MAVGPDNRPHPVSRGFARELHRRGLSYFGITLLFLAAGICAVWFVESLLEVESDAVLVAILVVPPLLYLTLSGRVSEIAGGGLTVRLNAVSRAPVSDVYVTADFGPSSDPNQPIAKTDPNKPHVVTLTHGRKYQRDRVLGRLKELAATSPVPLLIVLDDHDRVLAYTTYPSALDLLTNEQRGDKFIQLVAEGELDAFDGGGGFSAVKTETLPQNATNAEALATMEESGLDALVVVDRKGRFKGILERDRVLSRMMLALVSRPPVT